MEDTIEKLVLRVLGQVSKIEKERNKALERKTAKVLKAIEYMKAMSTSKRLGA